MTDNENPTWPNPPGVQDDGETPAETDEVPTDVEPDELTKITAERDEFLDQLQRSRAEFVNFRRRNDQERAQLRQVVAKDVLAQFLPVIDDLDRALAIVPDEDRDTGWMKGVAMIQTKLHSIADRLGVTQVDAIGQPFDPSIHESVATEPGSAGSHVIEVYQNGYRIGDVLVRPAMVKTGNPPAETTGSPNKAAFNA